MNPTRIITIAEDLATLTDAQLDWVERLISQFRIPIHIELGGDHPIVSLKWATHFGNALVAHHANSDEDFKKERFEFGYLLACRLCGLEASKPESATNSGHDLIVSGKRLSLKTQGDKDISPTKIHISKYRELGGCEWVLESLRNAFLEHLARYDEILILRSLLPTGHKKRYELLEIPKHLLLEARTGELEFSARSKGEFRSGACYVPNKNRDELKFKLYFDGQGERKLQLTGLRRADCVHLATWEFDLGDALATH